MYKPRGTYQQPASIERTVAPTALVVSVSELKTHLRVTHSDDDTYIEGVIKAAQQLAERHCYLTLPQATFKAYYDEVDDLEITRHPVQSITSIQYYNFSDVLTTISSDNYKTDLNDFPARVWFDAEFETNSDRPAACIVTFVAGYADVADIDSGLKQAIKMIAADMYDQRMSLVHGSTSKAIVDYRLILNAFSKQYFA